MQRRGNLSPKKEKNHKMNKKLQFNEDYWAMLQKSIPYTATTAFPDKSPNYNSNLSITISQFPCLASKSKRNLNGLSDLATRSHSFAHFDANAVRKIINTS